MSRWKGNAKRPRKTHRLAEFGESHQNLEALLLILILVNLAQFDITLKAQKKMSGEEGTSHQAPDAPEER